MPIRQKLFFLTIAARCCCWSSSSWCGAGGCASSTRGSGSRRGSRIVVLILRYDLLIELTDAGGRRDPDLDAVLPVHPVPGAAEPELLGAPLDLTRQVKELAQELALLRAERDEAYGASGAPERERRS